MSAVLKALDGHIEAAGGPGALLSQIQPLQALDAHALALMHFKTREVILEPWLHTQDLCMVFAARGIGKTHFAMSTA